MPQKHLVLAAALLSLFGTLVPTVRAQQSRDLNEEFRLHKSFHSKFRPKDRDIIVWLPPGYDSTPNKRYPVLYMHDGYNVFARWRIDETAKALISNGQIEPLIIVFVPSGGTHPDRFDEYTPTRSANFPNGGQADSYGRLLVEELKPFIDSEYRTLVDSSNTGIGGVSLGALVSLYFGFKYPTVFGKLAVMSPSLWWDNWALLREAKALKAKLSTRIWLDIGAGEGSQMISDAKALRDSLTKKGWILKSDLIYFEAEGGTHNEASFAKRAGPMLTFLFGRPEGVK
ncbi:MAG: alpha/beta hydrolase-fold protein [Pyrinomonadaceae bacterium]|nr:alpha/beta hydrolase-fold protein [Pyrinomonadaceae bacterium]